MNAVRDWLYIGKYRDTINGSLLQVEGIGAVLQLAEHVAHPGIETLYLAVEDGEPIPHDLLGQGITFIMTQRAMARRVLVACGAGISRSATFCVAALHEAENLPLPDAYRDLVLKHPDAMPHMKLWHSLLAYYGQDVSLFDAARQVTRIYRENASAD